MIAILPAAGKGTRMASVAAGLPKELLALGGKPLLQWALEEASAAGALEAVVVVSPDKPKLEGFLAGKPGVRMVEQPKPEGLAPAVLLAWGVGPVLVILPDTVFFPKAPSSRLAALVSQGYDVAVAVEQVADESVSQYGIVECQGADLSIARILEKPRLGETASRWAVAGRFALSDAAMRFVCERLGSMGHGGKEIHLPPILGEAAASGLKSVASPLERDERRLDCGNPEGYLAACEAIR